MREAVGGVEGVRLSSGQQQQPQRTAAGYQQQYCSSTTDGEYS